MAAKPRSKAYGAVSVKVAYWATASVVGHVPPSVFLPRPNVDRAVREVELLRDAGCRRLRRARHRVAGNADHEGNESDDPTSHRGTIAGPRHRRKQSESGASTRAHRNLLPKDRCAPRPRRSRHQASRRDPRPKSPSRSWPDSLPSPTRLHRTPEPAAVMACCRHHAMRKNRRRSIRSSSLSNDR